MSQYINPGQQLQYAYLNAVNKLDDRHILPNIINKQSRFTKMSYLTTVMSLSNGGAPIRQKKMIGDSYYNTLGGIVAQSSVAPILSNNNTYALITLTGSANENYLYPDLKIFDPQTKVMGKVMSKAGSTVYVSFDSSYTSGVTAFTASDFAAGATFVAIGGSPGLGNSHQMDGNKRLPQFNQFAIEHVREGVTLSYQEMMEKNRFTAMGKTKDGQNILVANVLIDLKNDFSFNMNKALILQPERIDAGNTDNNRMASFQYQITNKGGQVFDLAAAITTADIQNWLMSMKVQSGTSEVLGIFGARLLGAFQNALAEDHIKYVGTENTVGGVKVSGIDMYEYGFGGVKLKLAMNMSDLDHPMMGSPLSSLGGTQLSNSGFLLDTTPVDTDQGTLPFVQWHSYGKDGESLIHYTEIPGGMIDGQGNRLPNGTANSGSLDMAYSYDANLAGRLTDPSNHAFINCNI